MDIRLFLFGLAVFEVMLCWANLLARGWTQRSKVVVLKVVVLLLRVATRSWHRVRRQVAVALEVGGRRSDLGVGTATACGHTRVDTGHAETVRTRQSGREPVALVVLGRGSGLAMRRSAVVSISRESVVVTLAVLGLQVEELHLSVESPFCFFEILVFNPFSLKLASC